MNVLPNRRSDPDMWRIGTSCNTANPADLKKIKEAGMNCIELTWYSHDLFDPSVKKLLGENVRAAGDMGIEVWSAHIPFGTHWDPSSTDSRIREEVIRNASGVFDVLREWGIRRAVFHPSWEPIMPEEREQRLALSRETLQALGRRAAESGIRLAVECLPRTCIGNRASEIETLVGDNPGLGICCDVNHLFKETPQQFIGLVGSSIITTHISDNDGIDEKHWLPGEGVIQWREVIDALAGAGYDGAFMFETRNRDPFVLMETWRKLVEWRNRDD